MGKENSPIKVKWRSLIAPTLVYLLFMLGQIDIGLNISSLGYLINTSICNKSMSQFIFCYTIYLLKIKIHSCQFLNLNFFTNLFPYVGREGQHGTDCPPFGGGKQ
jgi:hypothetical protein